jgi:glycosyltransferase involved in cell wall biosynthesis
MESNLKITVVTVSFNAVTTIEETIKSVVDQTYPNIEYIIIDGGSTDGTVDIIKKYVEGGSEYGSHNNAVTYWVSEPDRGIYDAMNKGITLASGDYINFMNAGDSFVNNHVICKVVSSINRESVVVYGDTLKKMHNNVKLDKSLQVQALNHKGILCHQSAFTLVAYHKRNLFDLKYKILADFNFFFNAYNNDKQLFQQLDFAISIFDMTDGGISKTHYNNNYKELREIVCNNVSYSYIIWLHLREKLGVLKRLIFKRYENI